MKSTITHLLVLLVGIAAGAGLPLLIRIHQKQDTQAHIRALNNQRQTEGIVRWQTEGPAASQAYFNPSTPVPIPWDLNLSTNAWQKLNYWSTFTRSFLWYQSPKAHRVSLVSCGPKPDPWDAVVNFEDSSHDPHSLAMQALEKLRAGEDFDTVRTWVSENATYSSDERFNTYINAITNGLLSF